MSKYLCADCVSKEQCSGEWVTHCVSYIPKEHKQTNTDFAWSKDDLFAWGMRAKYEEPKYKFERSFEKFIKKWLRMQKKNRRRWGG